VDATPDADILVTAALLHSSSSRPAEECRAAARAMGDEERTRFIAETFRHMKGHDSVLREFENVRCVFEITLSAACYGQLKRHRMATMNTQPYDLSLGVTVPASISAAGAEADFMGVVEETGAAYRKIAEAAPTAAPYALTNAHRRRVVFAANARELYHISRLREDPHAQWDIREKSASMLRLAKKAMPATLQFAMGKHLVDETRARLFRENSPEVAAP
jgi:thymidylate synthase ThyX